MTSPETAIEIEELLRDANDPKDRLMLIVLNRINNSLVSNSELTRTSSELNRQMAARLEEHITSYEENLNKGRGAWKVIAWVLGLLQFALGSSLVVMKQDAVAVQAALNAHSGADAALRLELLQLANSSSQVDIKVAAELKALDERCRRAEVLK